MTISGRRERVIRPTAPGEYIHYRFAVETASRRRAEKVERRRNARLTDHIYSANDGGILKRALSYTDNNKKKERGYRDMDAQYKGRRCLLNKRWDLHRWPKDLVYVESLGLPRRRIIFRLMRPLFAVTVS